MKCTLCGAELQGTYLIDSWQQPICACHKVEYCSSCGRFVKPVDLHLPDGRCLCSFCKPSIVSLPQHIEWVGERVRSMLSLHGIHGLPIGVPIMLVPPNEMARLNGMQQVNLLQLGLTRMFRTTELFVTKCKYSVYILDYLPKIQFAGVLAHEMLHVWQHEKNISLNPMLTEGFCNLGSYVVYAAINTELSRHFMKSLEEDPNPIYGNGFRRVLSVYRKEGNLQGTMNIINNFTN